MLGWNRELARDRQSWDRDRGPAPLRDLEVCP